jgi:hypothetical protein
MEVHLWNLKIKEILSKENMINNFISSVKGNSFTILFCAIKVTQIQWTNIHKISFVNFQWSNGWSLIDKKFYNQNSMIEKLNLHGLKFIHEIMVARKDIPFIRDIHGHSGLQ